MASIKPDLDSQQQQQRKTTNQEENCQLQELLSSLKSELLSREDKLKHEIKVLKEQNYSLNLQYNSEKTRKSRAEREVGKLTAEIGALKDQISCLGGEKSVWSERVAKAEEREKGWVEQLKKVRDECMEHEIRKQKAEAEVDIWRRKFSELEARVSRLQDDVLSLAQLAGLNVAHHFDSPTTGGTPPSQNVVIIDSDDDFLPQSTQSQQEKASGTQILKRKLSSCEKTSGNRNSNNPDIEDVDDNSPSGKYKMDKFQDSICKRGGSANHGTATAASSATASKCWKNFHTINAESSVDEAM